MTSFRGWPAEALDFYDGLVADNTKAYWTDHKAAYEELVRAPMLALLEELEPEFGEGRIFRPYRDVRFAKDKTPYKTNIGAMVSGGYVGLSAEGLACGAGYYRMSPDQLARYRAAVDAELTYRPLAAAIAHAEEAGLAVVVRDPVATAPRGYAKDHPRIALIRGRGLTTWREWEPAPWLGTAKSKDRVVATLRASQPLLAWLDDHVGPAQ